MNRDSAIAFFDSGMGGLSVLKECAKSLKNENFIYYADTLNVPYGNKNAEEIYSLALSALNDLKIRDVKVVVFACNTVTTACINKLRQEVKDIDLIGLEPAIKPALNVASGEKILVLSTGFTTERLKEKYDNDNLIFCPLNNLASQIEMKYFDKKYLQKAVKKIYNKYKKYGIKHIVLGCSHYILIKDIFKEYFWEAEFYDGNSGVCKRLRDVLDKKSLLRSNSKRTKIAFYNTKGEEKTNDLYIKILNE